MLQPTARDFPAGSYVIRMDQPYSRVADALLDYQYWSPDDPQELPTTIPAGPLANCSACKLLALPTPRCSNAVAMERVTELPAFGGATGEGIRSPSITPNLPWPRCAIN